MKTIFFLFTTCAITFASQISYAQENRSIDEKGLRTTDKPKPIKNKLSVFASGGTTLASANMKDSSFIGNGWNVEGGVYIPLFFNRKGGQSARYVNKAKGNIKNNFTIGVEAGINYAHHKTDGGESLYSNIFRLSNGNGGETPLFEKTAKYYANSFQFFAGPKAEWNLNKISISPSVLLGYTSLNRKGYTLGDSIVNPKQTTESKYIPFITTTKHSVSGFVIKPKIELGYYFTEQLSLFASAAIAFGPAIQNNVSFWKPRAEKGTTDVYSYDQFVSGAAKSTILNSRWQTTSINVGLRYTWIKRSPDAQSTEDLQSAVKSGNTKKPGGAVSSSYAAGRSVAQTDSTKKPGGAVSSSYAAGRSVAQTDSTNNTKMPNRLSMTPTTTRQTQQSNFGEKVSTGMQSGENIIQTDSTNKTDMPGRLSMTPTTTKQTQQSNFGEKVSTGMQSGENIVQTDSTKNTMPSRLSMTPTTTRQTQQSNFGEKVSTGMQSGRNIVQTDSTNKTAMPSRLSMTPTTTRQTQQSTFGEKVASGMQSGAQMIMGQPIPGIVVKGGKNRTGELITAVSGDDGEVELNNLEKGIYLFQLTENSNQQRKVIVRGWNPEKKENIAGSANKTNDSTSSPSALVAGNPIPGIIVKGGKNPGASFTTLTVNNDGQISFKVLQPGNYKLIIETPGNNTSLIDNSKGKTASGIQNVLKTRHETAKNSISNVR